MIGSIPHVAFKNVVFILVLLGLMACQEDATTPNEQTPSALAPIDTVAETPEAQLAMLNRQLQKEDKDYGLYQQRSEAYFLLDSLDLAVADIEKAIQLYEEGPELHYWRGFLAYVQDDTALAMKELRVAEGLGSQSPEVPYQIGQIFFLQKKYPQAMEAYKTAARKDAYDPQYIFAQGFLEESRGAFDKAVQLYKQSLGIDSSFAKSLTRLHDVYLEEYESEEEAMKYVDILLRYNPTHPMGRYQQGNYHLRRALSYQDPEFDALFKQHLNDAVLSYTIAVNKDPQFSAAYYSRGFTFVLGEGRIEEALLDFRRTLELDSTHAQAHFMMGSVLEKNGDYAGARDAYAQASRYKPESVPFRQAVADMEERLR